MNKYWSVAFLVLLALFLSDAFALKRLTDYTQMQDQIISDYWKLLRKCDDETKNVAYLTYQRDRATDFVESLARCSFMKLKPEACGMTPGKVHELLEENRNEE